MYDIQFTGTSSAGWAESVSLTDDDTNLPLDLTGITFELDVRDDCGRHMLTATTENAKIETPGGGVVQWRFSPEETGSLCRGNTYRVGLIARDAAGATQLCIGTLAFIDGVAQ